MGEQRVSLLSDKQAMQKFVKSLLSDVQALEYMLDNDWFESGVTRIGAEQEMVLVHNKTKNPACVAMEALESMSHLDWVETELAKFNLETNLQPRELVGDCFAQMDLENSSKLDQIQEYLDKLDVSYLLTGILPTLRKYHLDLDNLTPKVRYRALMDAMSSQLIGSSFELRLVGIDELLLKHDSPMLEACNTSFQVHLQVDPHEFVKMYNIAQALAAPTMAIAANSPLVFGKRLWHESRIAMFQQALDTRTTHEHMRERSPRVSFGKKWLDKSVLEIYQEDITRFKVLLSSDIEEDSLQSITDGKVPKLRSLQVHNSTVYRWNRPCYGISDNGKPHLRIENRVLPAGPTKIDEIANAMFWLGCMIGMADEVDDVRELMSFDDAHDNFGKAAKFGIDSNFTWFNDDKVGCCDLIINKLLPMARKGLAKRKVDQADIDKYLNVIEQRAQKHMNGSRWILRSYTELKKTYSTDESLSILTASMIKNQRANIPGHDWVMPDVADLPNYTPHELKVSDFMITDVFTVQKDAVIELVAEMMDWKQISFTPVEDTKGKLIGMVSDRLLLKHFVRPTPLEEEHVVEDIMIKDPITIVETATIIEALQLMKKHEVGCLPVTRHGELVGIITESDFLRISGRLIERLED